MFAEVKYVDLATGVRVQYVEQGSRLGVPVVMLHGYSDSWHSFEPVLPLLPSSIHAYAISQRGHGNTGRPTAGYRPSDFAEDVAQFMDALEIDSAVVVGHSLGSLIAQRFALDYPHRTIGLVLIGSGPAMRGNPVWSELRAPVLELTDPVDPRFVREFQESTLAQPIPPTFLERVVQESRKLPARVWRSIWHDFADVDHSDELAQVMAPTLVTWGDQDSVFGRSDQEAIVAAVPDARLVVYAGAGHGTHWEEPERFASDLVAFVRRVAD
jgi:pimeloyl-ACP methyl ester carboxylesterase